MWGSSFADLAKKAAELQEQAATSIADNLQNVPTASSAGFTSPTFTSPTFASPSFSTAGGFFNMDNLQQQEEDKDTTVRKPDLATTNDQTITPQNEKLILSGDQTVQDTTKKEGKVEQEIQQQQQQNNTTKDLKQDQAGLEVVTEKKKQKETVVNDEIKSVESQNDNVLPSNNNDNGKHNYNENDKEDDFKSDEQHEEQVNNINHNGSHSNESQNKQEEVKIVDTSVPSEQQQQQQVPTGVPEEVLNQFSQQLKRLEENHSLEKKQVADRFKNELSAMKRGYQQEVYALQQELAKSRQAMAQSQQEQSRNNESINKKVHGLERDLEQSRQIVKDHEREFKRLQERHLQQLRGMEKQVFQKEDESIGNVERLKSLEKDLEESKAALDASKEEYKTLKERTKVVAGELKERRAECRTFAAEINVLKANNHRLQDQITLMQGESMDMTQNSKETQQALNTLKGKVMDLEKELEESQAAIQQEAHKGEETLATYKKKAQQSLAVANARTASAIQAREEAELDARAARSTADSAMERAVKAELDGKEAQAKAKSYVTAMQQKVAKYDQVEEALNKATNELEETQMESKSLSETNGRLTCELQSVAGRLEASQKTVEDLKSSLSDSQTRSNELFEETERLRLQCHRLKDDIKRLEANGADSEEKKESSADRVTKQIEQNTEAEATIAMLQRELHDANVAIKELKETLRITVEEAEAMSASNSVENAQAAQMPVTGGGGSGGDMPLFYAMEKQAELTQARNEIARLANLLGDSESDKQEAVDAMYEMEKKMNDARSKLKRQEQLGSPSEEGVNLEYLKNVTLSFLNAKTVTEKKMLLPVIGTVLCLTPDELKKATDGLDSNNGYVMDSVTSSVMSFGWGS